MPRAGGESDKLGNRYESLWTTSMLLRLAAGEFRSLIIESHGDDAVGVEFVACRPDGIREFHSVKRQRADGDWTLSALTRASIQTRRSVLGDLVNKLNCETSAECNFISSTGANDLREICERAKRRSTQLEFDKELSSSKRLYSEYTSRFLPLALNDHQLAYKLLRRLNVVLIDEATLTRQVEQQIAFLVYRPDLRAFENSAVRVLLDELIVQNLGNEIHCDHVWNFLEGHGFCKKSWAADSSLLDIVQEQNQIYLRSVTSELIAERQLHRAETQTILEELHRADGSRILLLSASAGMGKSCVMAQLLENLYQSALPVIVVRMDRHGDAKTTQDIGTQMRLPRSPPIVLAGLANGAQSVLVVDQLDATSQVSGRYPHLWEVFECILNEAKVYPNMRVVIACRDFDLQHDHRLRKLRDSLQTQVISLGRLTMAEVDAVITSAGGDHYKISQHQKDLLCTPLHLFLFLTSLKSDQSSYNFGDLGDLLEKFWDFKQRCVRERLNGHSAWAEVIDRILEEMNTTLALYTSEIVLDSWPETVQAMLTEHVLVRDGRQIRFFHESFFDYAFARYFLRTKQSLVPFLLSSEQHLFRRAQVRQILAFLRDHNRKRYLAQLSELLNSNAIRFHLKRLIVAWLGSLPDPSREEWEIVEPLLVFSSFQRHLLPSIRKNLAWFDLLDSLGVIEKWLSSTDSKLPDRGIWFLILDDVKKFRSERATLLLEPYEDCQGEWADRIRRYFEFDGAQYSRPIQKLFLKLLADGIFDQICDNAHDCWWGYLRLAGKQAPDFVLEATCKWMDLQLEAWLGTEGHSLFDQHNREQSAVPLISEVAKAVPLAYVEEILPRVTKIIQNSLCPSKGDLQRDKVWYIQRNGEPIRASEALIDGLVQSLEMISKDAPDELEKQVPTLTVNNSFTLAFLLLRAWSANPEKFATTCLQHLATNPNYLDVGYGSWSGKGNGHAAISREALLACVPYASLDARIQLEVVILNFAPSGKADSSDEWHERLLLEAFGAEFLSDNGRKRLQELRTTFPEQELAIPSRSPKGLECVQSPVPPDEAAALSDEQWLEAMRQYNYGWDDGPRTLERIRNGSAVELSRILRPLAREQRVRFANLTHHMDDSIRPEYFGAILDGICSPINLTNEERDLDDEAFAEIETDVILNCVHRLHALPSSPCGNSICGAFERIADRIIPTLHLDIVRHYAINDPNPSDDGWRQQNSDLNHLSENAYSYGYNTVRGQAARTIKSLLFADISRSAVLVPILAQMTQDRSIAVRICVIEALLPVLNHDRDQAVKLFCQLCQNDPVIIGSHPFENFVSYASSSHYSSLQKTLQTGLHSSSESAQSAAARQICLAAFMDETAELDAEKVRNGSISMRTAAAQVYAYNLGDSTVGRDCTEFLCRFFYDPDEKVRHAASECFLHLDQTDPKQHLPVIESYIDGPAFPAGHDGLLRILEDSTWQLPDLTIRLAQKFVQTVGSAGGNIVTAASFDAQIVSKLIVRLYSQSNDEGIRSQCLDIIDEMELYGYHGIDSQLAEHDR